MSNHSNAQVSWTLSVRVATAHVTWNQGQHRWDKVKVKGEPTVHFLEPVSTAVLPQYKHVESLKHCRVSIIHADLQLARRKWFKKWQALQLEQDIPTQDLHPIGHKQFQLPCRLQYGVSSEKRKQYQQLQFNSKSIWKLLFVDVLKSRTFFFCPICFATASSISRRLFSNSSAEQISKSLWGLIGIQQKSCLFISRYCQTR